MNNKDFLIISILTFITVLSWIFFDAYHTYKTSTIPEDLKVYLTPLKINLTKEGVEKIKSRPDIFSFSESAVSFPQEVFPGNPSYEASPEASPSGEISPFLESPYTP